MKTPHGTGMRAAAPALCLLAACSALAARDAEGIGLDSHDRHRPWHPWRTAVVDGGAHHARLPPGDPVGASVARDTIPVQSLLLWGGIDADRVPFLEPVFVIDAPPTLPRSVGEYVLTGRTGDGTVLFSLGFEMPVIADGDGSSGFLFVLPVEPGWEGRLASVTLTGPGGSATLDGDSHRPMAIVRNSGTGRIQRILRDLPPSVMSQAIADTAVTRAPGLEVLFSRGIPGPGAWRRRR